MTLLEKANSLNSKEEVIGLLAKTLKWYKRRVKDDRDMDPDGLQDGDVIQVFQTLELLTGILMCLISQNKLAKE